MNSLELVGLDYLKNYNFIGGWEDAADVFLWYRENGQRQILQVPNVPHYFCTTVEDYRKLSKEQITRYKASGFFDRGKIYGNYAYFYRMGKLWRKDLDAFLTQLDDLGIKPLEGDVNRVARLMIDLQLSVAPPGENGPRVAFFDIETDDRGEKIRVGEDRILSIAWKDQATGEEFFEICPEDTDRAEKHFLDKVLNKLLGYDILIGFNNYAFDDAYLEGRFAYHGIDIYRWRRLATLDVYNVFERQGTFRKYEVHNKRLDTISKAVLGRGKIPHKEKIYDLWLNNRELLREYNLEDVRLIVDMEKKLNSCALIMNVCSSAGLLHSFGYSPAKCVDTFILRKAVERRNEGIDFRYPTQYYRPEHKIVSNRSPYSRNALSYDKRKGRAQFLKEKYGIDYEEAEGGFVLDAIPGLYPRVVFSDFNSLYPSHIIAVNIGPDTLVKDNFQGPKNKAPNGVYFRTDFVSGMSEVSSYLLNTRAVIRGQMKAVTDDIEYKALDLQQNAIKELTNSIYGCTLLWGGRYNSKTIGEAITYSGRTYLPFGVEWYKQRGITLIAGDTDSLAVALDESQDAEKLTSEFVNDLRAYVKEQFNYYRPEMLKMSVEEKKTFAPMLILAKKNYAGRRLDGKIDIYGLQAKKGNIPRWSAMICKNVLEMILSQKHDSKFYERYLQQEKDRLSRGDVPLEDLFISARIGKDPDEYENLLPHIRIAQRLIENGNHVPIYSTLSYVITGIVEYTEITNDKKTKRTYINGLADIEIGDSVVIDAQHYWNKILMPQLEKYLDIVFPETDWAGFAFPRNLKRSPFELKVKVNYGNVPVVL